MKKILAKSTICLLAVVALFGSNSLAKNVSERNIFSKKDIGVLSRDIKLRNLKMFGSANEEPVQSNMDVTIMVTKNNLPFTEEELNFNFKDLATNEVKTVKSAMGMIMANLEVGHKYELTLDSEDKTIDKIVFTVMEGMGPIIEGSGEVLAMVEIKDKVAEKEVFATFFVQENNAPYTKGLNFSFKDVETGKVTTVDSENAMVNVFLTIGHKYEISLNSEEKTMKPVTILVGEEYPTLIDSEEPFTNITVEPKKEDTPVEEGIALDKLIVRVLKDGEAEANYQISLIYFDEFGIPNTVLKPKTDENGEIVLDELLANGKYQLRPARNANELKFEKDVFEFTTDKNGKVVTIDGKEIKDESEGVIIFKGTEPDSDIFEKFDVNFKAVDKDGNPIEGVNFSIMTLAPRFKTLQKVDSDANGNIKFNVEGQEGGKDYSVTISKMAQFKYESEPHSIEFKLDEKGNVKVLDTEEKYNMTFTVYENDQTHIYDEFKKLYEEAIDYLKNQKFEDTEDAKTAIKNLEDVIEASKKEIEETIPIYAEGKIEQLKKAMAELKKYEVKEETEPTDKPQPKPETKPETKPEVKPGNKIFEGVEIQRQSGINRYKTAVEISKKNFNSAETVILVNGMTEADALSASVLAKEKNAPILLIKKDSTPEEVKQEIERLGAKNIIVVGGDSSVSKKATKDFKQKVSTIAGKDRFETAVKIAKEAGKTDKLVIANGMTLVDALTASSIAQVENRGIILVKEKEIPQGAKEVIENAKDILIVGGNSSVNLPLNADRISGKDRFETAVKIAERAFKNPKQVALANSTAYADALVFGAVTEKANAPILLTRKDTLPEATKAYLEKNRPQRVYVLGGEDSVNTNLFK